MNRRHLLLVLILFGFSSVSMAKEPFTFAGGRLETAFNIHTDAMSLSDPADSISIGTVGESRIGYGGQAFLLYPLMPGVSFGPNFNFTYSGMVTSWDYLDSYQPSIGPALKFEWPGGGAHVFLNYNLGWVVAEQRDNLSNPTPGGTRPAGTVAANIRGWTLGARSDLLPITDSVSVGPYFTIGSLALIEFKYKSLRSGTYTDQWVNIGFSYIEVGATVSVNF